MSYDKYNNGPYNDPRSYLYRGVEIGGHHRKLTENEMDELEHLVPREPTKQGYCIAAINMTTGKRLLIKVSDLATREQLMKEVRIMNGKFRRAGRNFHYTLTTEGAIV